MDIQQIDEVKHTELILFPMEYQLLGDSKWRPAYASGIGSGEAISGFASGYSPSHGTVVAVRIEPKYAETSRKAGRWV